jgi:phytoene dehydrogenase-like protein
LEAIARGAQWQPPAGTISVRDWLSQYTDDERIYQVFQPICTVILGQNIYGLPISELFKFAGSGQAGAQIETMNYAVNGNSDLMESLAKAIEEKGGGIWKNAEAKRITVDQHRVTGVVVETGEGEWEVSAKAVVSNLGPKRTVDITGREHFDRAYLRELELVQPTSLIVASYVTSDEPLIEAPGVLWPIGSPNMVCHLSPTITCPELAPEGKHYLYSCSGITEPRTSPIDVESEIKSHLEELNRVIPEVEKRGTVLSVQCFHGDWPLYHSNGYNLSQRTPVVDLYNVGDGLRTTGSIGVKLCAETARLVVEGITSRIEPTGYALPVVK